MENVKILQSFFIGKPAVKWVEASGVSILTVLNRFQGTEYILHFLLLISKS